LSHKLAIKRDKGHVAAFFLAKGHSSLLLSIIIDPTHFSNFAGMDQQLHIYNSLTRKKEPFQPLNPPFVGIYVCGPTVYNEIHMGNARTFLMFDVIYRYLLHLGYKVRYVRNITDVGHLENDADEGEDKVSKKARLEQLEPMEIVQQYTYRFHKVMEQLNTKMPNIEPSATGHIMEQINMTKKLQEQGYAYEVNGTVYFNVNAFKKDFPYGDLSGRNVEEMLAESREDLQAQDEKKHPADFALWKKADPTHIMRWHSPWGEGFPGWHIECSVMSTKYLGEQFDIHGGGMDLKFPHHENEIAQCTGAHGKMPVRYWMHSNMLTVQGNRMSKSEGTGILPVELFTGNHQLLEKAFSPMVLRFFMLQTHYRSTLDFSNDAMKAAEKGYWRLMNAFESLQNLTYQQDDQQFKPDEDKEMNEYLDACYTHMNDDFNTALVLADLFELVTKINYFKDGQLPVASISQDTFTRLQNTFTDFVENILGLSMEQQQETELTEELVTLLIEIRNEARKNKDFTTADKIRDRLKEMNIVLMDGKEGTSWTYGVQ